MAWILIRPLSYTNWYIELLQNPNLPTNQVYRNHYHQHSCISINRWVINALCAELKYSAFIVYAKKNRTKRLRRRRRCSGGIPVQSKSGGYTSTGRHSIIPPVCPVWTVLHCTHFTPSIAKSDGNVSIMIAMENVGTREIVCGTTSNGR